jgi:hypothetical protein
MVRAMSPIATLTLDGHRHVSLPETLSAPGAASDGDVVKVAKTQLQNLEREVCRAISADILEFRARVLVIQSARAEGDWERR